MNLKLISDVQFDEKDFTVIKESNAAGEKYMYLEGPYMAANKKNRNKRRYIYEEMVAEVGRYQRDYISKNRALAELNHPQSAEVNPKEASDLILELREDGNTGIFVGRSKVLNTPVGKLVQTLINDGVQLGKSSRCLGMISEGYDDCKTVSKMKLITVDTVSDPSYGDAWVNGILENKSYFIQEESGMEPVFERLEDSLKSLPMNAKDIYIREAVVSFINSMKKQYKGAK